MKEATIINGFNSVARKIEGIENSRRGIDQEVVTLRLQINAIIRIIRWLFPINLVFKYLVKKEFNLYKLQLEERRKQLDKIKEGVSKEKPCISPNKTGRNEQCKCGSGKKYKKCCLTPDAELKRVMAPDDKKIV